mgnify:CR=1 FL=1
MSKIDVWVYKSKPDIIQAVQWKKELINDPEKEVALMMFCDSNNLPESITNLKDGDYIIKDLYGKIRTEDKSKFEKQYDAITKLKDGKAND